MNDYFLYEDDNLDYLNPEEYPEQERSTYEDDEPSLSPEDRNPSLR